MIGYHHSLLGYTLVTIGVILMLGFTFKLNRERLTFLGVVLVACGIAILYICIYAVTSSDALAQRLENILIIFFSTIALIYLYIKARNVNHYIDRLIVKTSFIVVWFIEFMYIVSAVLSPLSIFFDLIYQRSTANSLYFFLTFMIAAIFLYKTIKKMKLESLTELTSVLLTILSGYFYLMILRAEEFGFMQNKVNLFYIGTVLSITLSYISITIFRSTGNTQNSNYRLDRNMYLDTINKIKGMDNRNIRVFISSTFRDIQEERDELVKKVFPRIRKICENKGVTFNEVDLRWGITDEEKNEEKVLKICFDEINRSKPYFIGILGERYGWIPDKIPENVKQNIAGLEGTSVTEMEIQYGVLKSTSEVRNAFFYLRSPKYVESLCDEEKKHYVECPDEDIKRNLGIEEAQKWVLTRKNKLNKLKDAIRQSHFTVHENYESIEEFGRLVFSDFDKAIKEIADNKILDIFPFNEVWLNELFLRRKISNFTSRDNYAKQAFGLLDINRVIVITGEEGIGKSTFMAKLALLIRGENKDALAIFNFAEASERSKNARNMLMRFLYEMKYFYAFSEDIPNQQSEQINTFKKWIKKMKDKQKCFFIIDAINYIQYWDEFQNLVLNSIDIPQNVTFIVSTSQHDEININQDYSTLSIGGLSINEKRKFIEDMLGFYGKKLSETYIEYIASNSQTSNSLYLKNIIEQLRQYGEYFTLDSYINECLEKKTNRELYNFILERYERDYFYNKINITSSILSMIYCSRNGLKEDEILELAIPGQRLPYLYWSYLYLALQEQIINNDGNFYFVHESFMKVVYDRYIRNEQIEKEMHQYLIKHYDKRDLSENVVINLSYHMLKAHELEKLYEKLCDMDFLKLIWNVSQMDTVLYLTKVEEALNIDIIQMYKAVYENTEKQEIDTILMFARLSTYLSHHEESFKLYEYLLKKIKRALNVEDMLNISIEYAGALTAQENYDKAISVLFGVEANLSSMLRSSIFLIREDKYRIKNIAQFCYFNEAVLLLKLKKYDKALSILKMCINYCFELNRNDDLNEAIWLREQILQEKLLSEHMTQ